ncbi:RNA transcription, translation and transport factor protein-like isoform X1 [Rhipicephalus sanguineus]|uniref:RNA transcription, translation and transport factor protein isoform X2 n=1 Tax=Rhipicephalus sanguineus TaxID=34632 RepID=UPI00189602CA|nr:RNA transcription, translation and transport factor protein isoform X2 [Rhipicephalus sanguineus]XP_049272674.1 RNA transcription, translation and transport factor protein-like isoform X1 [Rhipicephalus sanguineus]
MFKRKLTALGFNNTDNFNIQSQGEFRSLVAWLEDQKIRHYKLEERAALRALDAPGWTQAFETYLQDLGCPHKSSDTKTVLDWLLGLAVHLEYSDDLDCQEFRQGVQALAQYLGVTQHPDHIVTLQGVCALIQERLSTTGQEAVKQRSTQGKPYPLKESSLGFDTGDPVLNHAAKVLRLLYVQDLRELQTRINEAIVAVQAITANPKTDTRLGKVGR